MPAARNLLWAFAAALPLAGLAPSAATQEAQDGGQLVTPDQAPLPSPKPTAGKLLPPQPAPAPEQPAPPAPRPAVGKLKPPKQAAPAPAPPAIPSPPPAAGDALPPQEAQCRDQLAARGVAFEPRPAIREGDACAVPHPLWVTRLGRGVELAPGGLMTCELAEASAAWTQAAAVEARRILGKELEALGQASTYVCRPRRSSGKMSEHATGNALDIASFAFADGSSLTVAPGLAGKEAEFLAAVRQAACGAFATVLGPGSDADHADHLHLDVAARGSGPFCQ